MPPNQEKAMRDNDECLGTARVLHEVSEYDKLESEYDEQTAISVTTKAFQRKFPEINQRDVRGLVKCTRALLTGKVDIAAEHRLIENSAAKAAEDLLASASQAIEVEQVD